MMINNFPAGAAPNFGMALIIKPEAAKDLTETSMKNLRTIERIGNELKDTQYVDLEIGKGLIPRIKYHCANAYLPPFKVQDPINSINPQTLIVRTIWDGVSVGKLEKGSKYDCAISLESRDAALTAYKKLKSAPSELEQAAELTKLIDSNLTKKAAEEAAKKNEIAECQKLAKSLLEKFGETNKTSM